MSAAVLAAVATFLALGPSATSRLRGALGISRRRPRAALDVEGIIGPAVGLLAVMVKGFPDGLIIAALAAPVAHLLARRARERRAGELARQRRSGLPSALDLLAAGLAAGNAPSGALLAVSEALGGPLAVELRSLALRLESSADPGLVWDGVTGDVVLGDLARALRRSEESGLGAASVVMVLADEIRRDQRAARRERARALGVRTAGPLGACFLPAFLLVGIAPTLMAGFGSLSW